MVAPDKRKHFFSEEKKQKTFVVLAPRWSKHTLRARSTLKSSCRVERALTPLFEAASLSACRRTYLPTMP
jgi:hypothetical protein